MSSLIFNSALADEANGNINFGSDSFYAMLVTFDYIPDKANHAKRSDVSDEVAASGGYIAGGFVVPVSVANDSANNRTNISLGGISISGASITARGAVYYKRRGGDLSADELVVYIDFGHDVTSSNGNWVLMDSVLRIQN